MYNRRSYIVYLTIQGAFSLFFTLITTVNLVYQAQAVHLTPLQLVLVGTVLETACFISQVPTGIFADIYSRRWSVIIGMFLIGAGFTLEGSIPLFITVLLSQVIWGVGSSFVDGALEAWIADEVGEDNIGHTFMRGGQVGQLAGLIGIVASVAIASIQLNLSIISGGLLFITLSIFLLFTMPEHHNQASTPTEPPSWKSFIATALAGGHLVRRSPILLIIVTISVFFGMSSEGMDRLWVAHLLNNIHVPGLAFLKPVVWFGIIQIVSLALATVALEIMRRRINTRNHSVVVGAQLALNILRVACILLFALTGNFIIAILALWGANITRQLNGPLYGAWLAQNIDPKVRATIMSFNSQLDACGQILGGPLVGWIGNFSLRAALALTSLLLAPVLPLYAWSGRKGAQAATREEPPTSIPT
ncbi:MAG: MFS transporter [Ktedonobacteraceae bacterium]|nr:MFS transporter [Ktedonobacteraceae bacterium]MBO0794782.1 MFS transporter [Ktedonobacteraceae bacterium]